MTRVSFVGSFPAADFRVEPALPEVAFLGRSNVGKSSLINAVVDRKTLAHTSRTPGKTRSANVYDVAGRYYLVDLPGYGYARISQSERRRFLTLLQAYLSERTAVAGVVWLLDVRREPSADDRAMAASLINSGVPVLVAITKADKLPRGRRSQQARAIREAVGIPEDQVVVTSARTKDGIESLRDSIEALVGRAGGQAVRQS